jgi:putative transposase
VLAISGSSVYYRPRPVSEPDLWLMLSIDELHLNYPFAGNRRLRDLLWQQGLEVGRRHVRMLMRKMAIEAIYRRPNTSKPAPGHKIYAYLLRGLAITRPNQVCAIDITYIPMARGFVYLAAVVDWFSRRVRAWKLSITIETHFCIEALEEALSTNEKPDFLNTDQAVSSPAKPLPGGQRKKGPGSAWTARVAGATTSSSSASGNRSSTRRFTTMPTPRSVKLGSPSGAIWSFTTLSGRTPA